MISKETFVKILNYIDNMDTFAEDLNQVFKTHDRHNWIMGYAFNDDKFQSMVLNLLSEAMGDADDWVFWWVLETDFGRDEYLRKIHDKEVVYDLASPEKLYDFLFDSYEK